MQASPSPALIAQVRRNAKRLAKQAAIPLHQAQDQIACTYGFANWSQFAKGSGVRALPAKPLAPTTRRHYLHGDQQESEPHLYYCAECDFFGDAEHFAGRHRVDHGERALKAMERFQRAPEDFASGVHRPANGPSILTDAIALALAAQHAKEAARSPFHRWMEQQRDREDPIGDLACDVMRDKYFPTGVQSLKEARQHLTNGLASRQALKALASAWREFDALPGATQAVG